MKDKTNRIINLHKVLAEIQSFLDKEAARRALEANSPASFQPRIEIGLSSTSRSRIPQSISVAQHYLSRHRDEARDLLETLPGDVFIVC